MKRIAVLIALLLITTGLLVPGTAGAAAAAPTIYGPTLVTRSATVAISGRTQPAAQVQLFFHKKGDAAGSYTIRRVLTANGSGVYRTSYVADSDYRYFARSGGLDSAVLLTQVRYLSISGPRDVRVGGTVNISGIALPIGSTVDVYFHKAGEPRTYYSLRRRLRSDAAGRWSTSYVENADYRYYATASGLTSGVVLTRVAPPWLQAVNAYRSAYGLAPVARNDALSAADAVHVRYMYLTGQLGHVEDPVNSHYTKTGDDAAGRSNVAGGSVSFTDVGWIDLWMNGPFHELGVLRPTLNSVGFASGTGINGSYAALDVLGDITRLDPGHWPKTFPSAAAPFPFLEYTRNEIPDPLSGCPTVFGRGRVSAPLLVSLGPSAPVVTSANARLVNDATGQALPVCVQTESTYRSSDRGWQSTGRALLGETHSIAVFASGALLSRTRYTFTAAAAGRAAVTVRFVTT